jgi:hypothetical protein
MKKYIKDFLLNFLTYGIPAIIGWELGKYFNVWKMIFK